MEKNDNKNRKIKKNYYMMMAYLLICGIYCHSWFMGLLLAVYVGVIFSIRIVCKADYPTICILGFQLFAVLISGAVLTFLSSFCMNESLLELDVDKIAWNAILSILVLCFFSMCFGSWKIGIALGMFVVLGFSTIDQFIYTFRSNDLVFSDLLAIRTAVNVGGNYTFLPSNTMVYAWLITVGVVLFICFLPKEVCGIQGTFLKRRVFPGVLTVLCAVAFFLGSQTMTTKYWLYEGRLYNGFLLNFALSISDTIVEKPDGYSSNTVDVLAEEYVTTVSSETYPNIIVIMDESFSDLSVYGNDLQTNIDVIPFYQSLRDYSTWGYALSSVYGGNTPNSEFEFLTGHSMGFFSQGVVPYQLYINTTTHSMVSELKSIGYKCVSMHPYYESGWSRTKVYSYLSFDESYFIDYFPQENLVREYVSDQECFEEITAYCGENRSSNTPLFLFCVTMQNHGGYDYDGENYVQSVSLNDCYVGEYPTVEQYLSLLHETDQALEYLISYFSDVDEPTVICFFGDHQPKLPQEFLQEINGEAISSLDEMELMYTVPFFVWSNFSEDSQYVERTSLNFLSNYVYASAEISLPAYNQFLQDVQSAIPAMNALGYYSIEESAFLNYAEAQSVEAVLLSQYEQMQYNGIFDEKNRNETLFGIDIDILKTD